MGDKQTELLDRLEAFARSLLEAVDGVRAKNPWQDPGGVANVVRMRVVGEDGETKQDVTVKG